MSESPKAPQEIEVSGPVRYCRIYTDADGETHFTDESLSFELLDFAPPAPPISVTRAFEAKSVSLISSPSGWHGDWHPAPRRQFLFVLVGGLEVQVSDGEVRRFGPGALCLVEDTTGKGHISRIVGPERGLAAVVPLADE